MDISEALCPNILFTCTRMHGSFFSAKYFLMTLVITTLHNAQNGTVIKKLPLCRILVRGMIGNNEPPHHYYCMKQMLLKLVRGVSVRVILTFICNICISQNQMTRLVHDFSFDIDISYPREVQIDWNQSPALSKVFIYSMYSRYDELLSLYRMSV